MGRGLSLSTDSGGKVGFKSWVGMGLDWLGLEVTEIVMNSSKNRIELGAMRLIVVLKLIVKTVSNELRW